jgi:hypothetical protein
MLGSSKDGTLVVWKESSHNERDREMLIEKGPNPVESFLAKFIITWFLGAATGGKQLNCASRIWEPENHEYLLFFRGSKYTPKCSERTGC